MADVMASSFNSLSFSSSSLLSSFSSSPSSLQPISLPNRRFYGRILSVSDSFNSSNFTRHIPVRTNRKIRSLKVNATIVETEQPKWWERNAAPNMIDIHSTQEFWSTLTNAGDRLVIVEFYGTWCASCRTLYPKLCRSAAQYPEILFLKVNFDDNKPMCKTLNVRVLPSFHFYHGTDGLLESFSCSLAKFQKIKDAIELHSAPRCSIGTPKGVGDLKFDILLATNDQQKKTDSA